VTRETSSELLRCSFCNKSQREVRKLIAGPNVYICDEVRGTSASTSLRKTAPGKHVSLAAVLPSLKKSSSSSTPT